MWLLPGGAESLVLTPRRQRLPSPRIIGNSPSCGVQLWGYRYPFPLPVLLFSMITQEGPEFTIPWSPPNPQKTVKGQRSCDKRKPREGGCSAA